MTETHTAQSLVDGQDAATVEAEEEEAQRAHHWNRVAITVAALSAVLVAVAYGATEWQPLRVGSAFLVFFAALFLMGTTMWVMSLQTERKRRRKGR